VRIGIFSAPKAGNHWIKCLLSQIYGLKWLGGEDKPDVVPEEFQAWIAKGGFPDGAIFHQHCRYTPAMADAVAAAPAHMVTIVRDPYDAFVSLYYWAQEKQERGLTHGRTRPRDAVVGKPLDHPDVLAYLRKSYGVNLDRALAWLQSGRAIPVRYEALHADPAAALTAVTDQIAPVPPARIAAAIDACTPDKMRQMDPKLVWHVRSAKVGDSRERLSEPHYAIFRERYANQIRALGYTVR
jgi:hypothetical protein